LEVVTKVSAASGEPRSALEGTYFDLRRLILRGEFAPGERLTGLRLSEMLGVSRTPIRSALVRLEAEGLIESERGQSARVRVITVTEVEQAYDVAGGLEGILVYRLAENGTEEQIGEISGVVSNMESAAESGDKDKWVEADERFHFLLTEYANNALISQMMERVENIIGQLRYFVLHTGPESAKLSAHEHRAVINAISRRDAERARRLHEGHWVRVNEVNTRFLRENLPRMRSYVS
jgi:DNA-binding GntR family transcriptional regulator